MNECMYIYSYDNMLKFKKNEKICNSKMYFENVSKCSKNKNVL